MTSPQVDTATARRVLRERRTEIAELLEVGGEVAAGVDDDPEQQALDHEAERRRRLELLRIDGALERLDGSEYGLCLACGEPISERRLELDPAVALCIDCAGRA